MIAFATDTTSWHAREVWLTINCSNTLTCTMCTLTLGTINTAICPECLKLLRVAFFTKLYFNTHCTSLRESITDSTGCIIYLIYIYMCVCVCVCGNWPHIYDYTSSSRKKTALHMKTDDVNFRNKCIFQGHELSDFWKFRLIESH